MEKKGFFIDDGYTEEFCVPESDTYNAINGTFRPMPGPMLAEVTNRSRRAGNDIVKLYQVSIDALIKTLRTWDVCEENGESTPINKANLERMRKDTVEQLFTEVMRDQLDEIGADEKNLSEG